MQKNHSKTMKNCGEKQPKTPKRQKKEGKKLIEKHVLSKAGDPCREAPHNHTRAFYWDSGTILVLHCYIVLYCIVLNIVILYCILNIEYIVILFYCYIVRLYVSTLRFLLSMCRH